MKIHDRELAERWLLLAMQKLSLRQFQTFVAWFLDSPDFSARRSVLAERTGVDVRQVRRDLAAIVDAGLLVQVGGESGSRSPAEYRLPDEVFGLKSSSTRKKVEAVVKRSKMDMSFENLFAMADNLSATKLYSESDLVNLADKIARYGAERRLTVEAVIEKLSKDAKRTYPHRKVMFKLKSFMKLMNNPALVNHAKALLKWHNPWQANKPMIIPTRFLDDYEPYFGKTREVRRLEAGVWKYWTVQVDVGQITPVKQKLDVDLGVSKHST